MKNINKSKAVLAILVSLVMPSSCALADDAAGTPIHDGIGGTVQESEQPPPGQNMLQGHVAKERPAQPPSIPIVVPRSDSIGGAVIEKGTTGAVNPPRH